MSNSKIEKIVNLINEEQIKEIQSRLAASSAGPWKWREPNYETGDANVVGPGYQNHIAGCNKDRKKNQDAEFIAHARSDIPVLIKAINEAKGIIVELETEIKLMKSQSNNKATSARMEKVLKDLKENPIPAARIRGGSGLPDLSRRKKPKSSFVQKLHKFFSKFGGK